MAVVGLGRFGLSAGKTLAAQGVDVIEGALLAGDKREKGASEDAPKNAFIPVSDQVLDRGSELDGVDKGG